MMKYWNDCLKVYGTCGLGIGIFFVFSFLFRFLPVQLFFIYVFYDLGVVAFRIGRLSVRRNNDIGIKLNRVE